MAEVPFRIDHDKPGELPAEHAEERRRKRIENLFPFSSVFCVFCGPIRVLRASRVGDVNLAGRWLRCHFESIMINRGNCPQNTQKNAEGKKSRISFPFSAVFCVFCGPIRVLRASRVGDVNLAGQMAEVSFRIDHDKPGELPAEHAEERRRKGIESLFLFFCVFCVVCGPVPVLRASRVGAVNLAGRS